MLSKYAHIGDTAYICFYDLQKVFDSVQHSVLLTVAYESGIVGRAWKVLESWYTSPHCMVKVNRILSNPFTLECVLTRLISFTNFVSALY